MRARGFYCVAFSASTHIEGAYVSVRGCALPVMKSLNKQAVEYLRELLARAESGEIAEICCVTKLENGKFEHCWTGCADLHELVGQMERMKFLTLRRMDV